MKGADDVVLARVVPEDAALIETTRTHLSLFSKKGTADVFCPFVVIILSFAFVVITRLVGC